MTEALGAHPLHGGRKLVLTPDGTTECPRPRIYSALVKAIARAHGRQRLLESGECDSVSALAAAETIDMEVECVGGTLRRHVARPSLAETAADVPVPPKRLRVLSPFDPLLRDRSRGVALRLPL